MTSPGYTTHTPKPYPHLVGEWRAVSRTGTVMHMIALQSPSGRMAHTACMPQRSFFSERTHDRAELRCLRCERSIGGSAERDAARNKRLAELKAEHANTHDGD